VSDPFVTPVPLGEVSLRSTFPRALVGDGSMLDHTLVVLCTEVCDGNTHLHDDLPLVLAGGADGSLATGRLVDVGYRRHGDLWVSVANRMGDGLTAFGDASSGPIPGL
jgi:hypothetical protein